jgi:hypothetical protein
MTGAQESSVVAKGAGIGHNSPTEIALAAGVREKGEEPGPRTLGHPPASSSCVPR